jgi:hypothetical protein
MALLPGLQFAMDILKRERDRMSMELYGSLRSLGLTGTAGEDDLPKPRRGRPAGSKNGTADGQPKKRQLSAAGRAAIAAGTRRRWAEFRAQQALEAGGKPNGKVNGKPTVKMAKDLAKARGAASGWPADPEERKAEMHRRMKVAAQNKKREESAA